MSKKKLQVTKKDNQYRKIQSIASTLAMELAKQEPNRQFIGMNPRKPQRKTRRARGKESYTPGSNNASGGMSTFSKGADSLLKMSVDTIRFASVYSDPFLNTPASLPVLPLLSHQRIIASCSGNGLTNSSGNGWIVACVANGVVNEQPTCCFSNGPTCPNDMTFSGTDIGQGFTNSIFASTDFSSSSLQGKQMRPVAYGVQIRYLGTTLNAAGAVYSAEIEPKGTGLAWFGDDVNVLKQNPAYKEQTFRDKRWHSITRHIQSQQDYAYQTFNEAGYWEYAEINGTTSPGSFDEQFNICQYITAQPNQPFEWRIQGHYEVVGERLMTRQVSKSDRKNVEDIVSIYKENRNKDIVTKDHSVGIQPTDTGGWFDLLKKGAQTLLPIVPEVIAMLL